MKVEPTNERLIEQLYPGLYRFAAVVAPRGDDPDDLVQDALVRTLARRSLSDIEYPSAFLRRTILNLANNRRRSLRRQLRALTRLGPTPPADDSYPSDTDALLDLAPQTRAVLWLADIEGLDFESIADQLGLTASAARQRASRGRAEIRTKDLVVRTDPPAQSLAFPGESITIYISSGTPLVLVPTVVTLFADIALATLRNVGLGPVVQFQTVPFGDPQVGVVIDQTPEAFGTVAIGSEVVISIGEAGPEPTTTSTEPSS